MRNKFNKTIYLYTLLLLIFISCKGRKSDDQNKIVEINFDSISITTDALCSSDYTVFSENAEINQFLGYNSKTNTLDIFNLEKGIFIRHLSLVREGPNGMIGKIVGIYYHNNDSIFIYSHPGSIYLINDSAKIIDNYSLFKFIGPTAGMPIINENFRLKYFANTGDLFFQNLYPTGAIAKYLDSSIVSMFNINSKKIKKSPIKFSKYFMENEGRVGFLRWMNLESIKGDTVLFNAQFDDELILFNMKLKSIKTIELNINDRTKYLDLDADSKEWVGHAVMNDHRFSFIYDKWRNIFYRLIWEGVPIKISDKYYNSVLDKTLTLEIYDENLNFVGAEKLPVYRYNINTWFINKNGLYISPTHPQSTRIEENKLKFEIIKIKIKNKK